MDIEYERNKSVGMVSTSVPKKLGKESLLTEMGKTIRWTDLVERKIRNSALEMSFCDVS